MSGNAKQTNGLIFSAIRGELGLGFTFFVIYLVPEVLFIILLSDIQFNQLGYMHRNDGLVTHVLVYGSRAYLLFSLIALFKSARVPSGFRFSFRSMSIKSFSVMRGVGLIAEVVLYTLSRFIY